MNNQELNNKFAELCGLCWHEWVHDYDDKYECSKCLKQTTIDHATNLDFIADPRLVLREMVRLNCAGEFIRHRTGTRGHIYVWISDILDTTEGRLVNAAIEFIEKEVREGGKRRR